MSAAGDADAALQPLPATAAMPPPTVGDVEDEEDSDSFAAHKREVRLGMRHRDSFAVHAKNLSGAALEEAIAAVNLSKKPSRLLHQDSVAVLTRKKHESQLDRQNHAGLGVDALQQRRVSRDDMSLASGPTSPAMHAQARGGARASVHELGASAHAPRMQEVVDARRVGDAPAAGPGSSGSGGDDAVSDDEEDDEDDTAAAVAVDGEGVLQPAALAGDAVPPSQVAVDPGPAGASAPVLQPPPPEKKKNRLRSMAKGVGSFLGLRKSKRRRQKDQQGGGIGAPSSAAPPPPPPGAVPRTAGGATPPPLPPPSGPRVAGAPRPGSVGKAGTAASGEPAVAEMPAAASPVRGILRSPVRKAVSPGGQTAASPASTTVSPGGTIKRKISFADQHGKQLNNVHFCDDLHYSAQADHSSADYGDGPKCIVM